MLENILHMALICPKMICCFEARSHSNVDKNIRKLLCDLIQNKSGTCFEARSTKYMQYKEKIHHAILRLIKAQVMPLH